MDGPSRKATPSLQRPSHISQTQGSLGRALSRPNPTQALCSSPHGQHGSCCPALCLHLSPPTTLPTSHHGPTRCPPALADQCPCSTPTSPLAAPKLEGESSRTLLPLCVCRREASGMADPVGPSFLVFYRFNLSLEATQALARKQSHTIPRRGQLSNQKSPFSERKGLLKLHSWQSCHFTTSIYTVF